MGAKTRYAIWDAAEEGKIKVVRDALAASPGLATEYEEFHYQPTTVMTLLHVAASRDQVKIMKLLLDAGADATALAPPGKKAHLTPLHCAARGEGPAIKLLLEAGADPSACVKRGVTPMYTAAYRGNLEGCRLLLEAGAHPDGKPSSKAPLHAAAMQSQVEVAELLLEHGAKLAIKSSSKNTALHEAAHRGDVAINRFLLERGLDPDQRNKKGQTPRELIADNFWREHRDSLKELYDAWGSSKS